MRIGSGFSFVHNEQRDLPSTTSAALIGAVVDALLSAAGILNERDRFAEADPLAQLKKIELRLHYDGFEIQNIDLTLLVPVPLAAERFDVWKDEIRKPLFLDKDQLTLKQYVLTDLPYLQIQALALIG